ncbi:putative acyl-CoA dehydrogenase [Aspergillus undulatus]|uniref:putative acyl-CoA dehydrogenase n=1 Tax=Aspergillus undulatus TaxID=1810928 RepID=UPI003CCD28CF
MAPNPATATTGHFTRPAPLENTYTSDPALRRILEWYLPHTHLTSLEPQLTRLGEEAVSEQIKEWSADAERNQPYVKGYNVWGEQYEVDRLVTSEGWKRLKAWGQGHGVVALGYEPTYGRERRLAQYAVNYLFSPSSGLTSCPISMTDGAALILTNEIKRRNLIESHPFHSTLRRLLSRDNDAWTSGQWMTERAGGSDVQNTETWAVHSPSNQHGAKTFDGGGDYVVSGFKFFSSATDADMALLLAKTEPSGKLSTFVAPLRTTSTSTTTEAEANTQKPEPRKKNETTNGIRIHRLKSKLGTKELPTAELSLTNTRAHLVGDLDKGVATIAPLLNITRAHTFIGSLAAWRRALSIAKAFAKARTTVNEPLWLIPMHLRLVADLEGRHRAAMEIGFFTVAVMNVVENGKITDNKGLEHLPKPGREATVIFRALTAVTKAVVSKMSILGIQECQEALGGVGYMDEPDQPEFNVSRILRNALVNSIWEGTTNVLASESVRFLGRTENMDVFAGWVERSLGLLGNNNNDNDNGLEPTVKVLREAWSGFKTKFVSMEASALLADGRRAMFTLAWILMGILLALDARRDRDPVTCEIARRWVQGELGVGDTVWRDVVCLRETDADSGETIRWDCRIAWGVDLPKGVVARGHRSMKL